MDEREALLAGDYNVITSLAETKEKMLQSLPYAALSENALTALRKDIAYNQTLISAALSGIAAARDRMKALAQVKDGLNVYNQNGQLAHVSAKPPAVERKA